MINNQTALLVIDVQNGLAQAADFNSLIAKINQRIKSYREKDQPIIFMQHTDAELPYGSPAWMLAAELAVQNEDQIFLKYHSDSFFETGLQNYLTNRQINQLEICGLQTEYCVDTAIRVGHHLGKLKFYLACIQPLIPHYFLLQLRLSIMKIFGTIVLLKWFSGKFNLAGVEHGNFNTE